MTKIMKTLERESIVNFSTGAIISELIYTEKEHDFEQEEEGKRKVGTQYGKYNKRII